MPQHNRSLSPWSLLILTALLAGGLWLWSRSQRTPPPASVELDVSEALSSLKNRLVLPLDTGLPDDQSRLVPLWIEGG